MAVFSQYNVQQQRMGKEGVSGGRMRRTKGKLMDSGARTRHLGTRRSHLNMGPTPIKHYFCNFARARNPTVWGRCQCCRGRGLGQMVLLTDRGPSGYLPDVWASLKAAAAANPDVPTVLLLVALDVDALSACAILMVRGLGPRAAPAAAHMRPPHAILPLARRRIRPGVLSDPCAPARTAAVGS